MKVRPYRFAMIPSWVLAHPQIHGRAHRIAVYIGIQAASFSRGMEYEWESGRQLAAEVSAIVGIPAETVRKYLREMAREGIVQYDGKALSFPEGPVDKVGTPVPTYCGVGTPVPKVGTPVPKVGTPVPTPHALTCGNAPAFLEKRENIEKTVDPASDQDFLDSETAKAHAARIRSQLRGGIR